MQRENVAPELFSRLDGAPADPDDETEPGAEGPSFRRQQQPPLSRVEREQSAGVRESGERSGFTDPGLSPDSATADSATSRHAGTRFRVLTALPALLPRPKLATPSLAPMLGIAIALVTLVVGVGWLVAVDAIQARNSATALNQRLTRGLDATLLALRDERSRTLLTAEAVSSTPGLSDAVASGETQRSLQILNSRHKAVPTALLAVVDTVPWVLAADPATNLPLARSAPAREALAARSAVTTFDGAQGLALLAAAPLRQDDRTVGAVLALQPLDDRIMESAERDSDLAAALIAQGRVVAATRQIRARYSQNRNQPVAIEPAGRPGEPSRLTIGSAVFAVASQSFVSLGNGREVTLVVGEQLPERSPSILTSAFWLRWGSPFLAAALTGIIGWLIGRRLGRDVERLAGEDVVRPSSMGREISALSAAIANERSGVREREALARAEINRLHDVLDAIRDGIIVSDASRRVIVANLAARRLLGISGAGANGDVIAFLPPPEGSAEIQANARTLRSYSAPLASSGIASGAVTVLHDATDERETERLKSEFLSVVSHELQTPLAAIVGAADLLVDGESGGLNGEQVRFLNAIRRNSHRLMALVSDLLDVSRLEAGRVELDLQPVDLGTLARSTVRSMANLFEQKSQSIVVDASEGLPPARGDRRRIEQILANLLANAGQYTPAGGHVRVEIKSGDEVGASGTLVLSVADDGPGISLADQARIFDKFYRGSNAAARRERGSGLGLSIVRSLAELHGGKVWVESEPGRGARFSIALPISSEEDE